MREAMLNFWGVFVDCMNASSFIEIIEIALHHIGDDVHVVLTAAAFEGTAIRARGVQAQDCFGCHYFGYRPPKEQYIYTFRYTYTYYVYRRGTYILHT